MAENTTPTTPKAVKNIATVIPTDIFDHLARNAGCILSSFAVTGDSAWKVDLTKIIGATSGGVTFTDSVEYIDYGEDIDNCPKNMMELKRVDTHEAVLSGSFVSASLETLKALAAASDLEGEKITPRADLDSDTDFADLWYVCDYGKGGAIAIHLMNALNTAGFSIETKDREKGQFAFEFTGHYSMAKQDTVPYEIYVKESEKSDSNDGDDTTPPAAT